MAGCSSIALPPAGRTPNPEACIPPFQRVGDRFERRVVDPRDLKPFVQSTPYLQPHETSAGVERAWYLQGAREHLKLATYAREHGRRSSEHSYHLQQAAWMRRTALAIVVGSAS